MSLHILNGGIAQQPDDDRLKLEVVRHRVLGKPYSKWRAIIAETGNSDTDFLICLKRLFGITIDKTADPMLYITQDTQQMRQLEEQGVANPTLLQILLTTRAIALDEQAASELFIKRLKEDGAEPQPEGQ